MAADIEVNRVVVTNNSAHIPVGIISHGVPEPMMKLIDSKTGSFQHNIAIAFSGIKVNEDNVSDVIEGSEAFVETRQYHISETVVKDGDNNDGGGSEQLDGHDNLGVFVATSGRLPSAVSCGGLMTYNSLTPNQFIVVASEVDIPEILSDTCFEAEKESPKAAVLLVSDDSMEYILPGFISRAILHPIAVGPGGIIGSEVLQTSFRKCHLKSPLVGLKNITVLLTEPKVPTVIDLHSMIERSLSCWSLYGHHAFQWANSLFLVPLKGEPATESLVLLYPRLHKSIT